MGNNNLKDQIGSKNYDMFVDNGYDPEDFVFFVNPCFDGAAIGVDYAAERVVYDYDKMVEAAMKEEGWDYDEAVEWIEYNTIRSLPYVDNAPIIFYPLDII